MGKAKEDTGVWEEIKGREEITSSLKAKPDASLSGISDVASFYLIFRVCKVGGV